MTAAYRRAVAPAGARDLRGDGRRKEDCISGWLADAQALVPEGERRFTRTLMDYYVGVLRADPAKTAKLCGR